MKRIPQEQLIEKVVELGAKIRKKRLEGNLLSVVPPTLCGYPAFLRVAQHLPHLDLRQVAMVTLLGNASLEDRQEALGLVNQVFGHRKSHDPESFKEADFI